MKKLALLITLSCFAASCTTMKDWGNDISNIKIPDAPKLLEAPTNPNDKEDKLNAYKAPKPNVADEKDVDIQRDFPAYHTSPRFNTSNTVK